MKTTLKIATAILIMVFAGFISCKKNEPSTGSAGNLTVKLTDSPGDYSSLKVEIKGVEAYLEGKGWVTLNSDARIIDMLTLTNGTEVVIAAKAGVKIGHYTKIKLIFGDHNSITMNTSAGDSASSSTAAINLGSSNEVEVAIDENVTANANAEALLDFNVANSVVVSGGGSAGSGIGASSETAILIPSVKAVIDAETGIKGDIDGAISAVILVTNAQSSFSTYADADGKFLIRGLVAGTYKVVISALHVSAGLSTGATATSEIVIENVKVTQGSITSLGVIYGGG